MNKKIVRIIFINEKIKKEVENLLKKDGILKKAYNRSVEKLRSNHESGQKVPQELWPKEYITKYKIDNLWRYDIIRKHPGWRLIYTIRADEITILGVVLGVMNHKKYDRLFGYG